MVKRYYIQHYPEYSGSPIASKIMSRTFRSITLHSRQKERENRAQMQSWKQTQF